MEQLCLTSPQSNWRRCGRGWALGALLSELIMYKVKRPPFSSTVSDSASWRRSRSLGITTHGWGVPKTIVFKSTEHEKIRCSCRSLAISKVPFSQARPLHSRGLDSVFWLEVGANTVISFWATTGGSITPKRIS